ncbi:MAG: hypothetical protein ACYDAS_04035 [Patescibacteria group bacterium]
MLKNRKYIYLIILILIVVVLLYSFKNKTITTAPNSINKLVIAQSITNTGTPSQITNTFNHSVDRNIYMFVYLKNPVSNESISYIRYFNGYYVDSYSVKTSSKTNRILYFNWNKTHKLDYPTGVYTIKVFINGVFLKSVSYKVT